MNQVEKRKEYSQNIGDRSEDLFASLCKKKGCNVIKATRRQDIYEHWDCKVISQNKKVNLVDVKAIKDNNPNLIYLELIGTKGYDGWLLGKADIIAFQQEFGFALFKRLDLLNWCLQRLNLQSVKEIKDLYARGFDKQGNRLDSFKYIEGSELFILDKRDAIYKLYTRPPWNGEPRHDVMTKARMQDMMNEIQFWLLK